MKYKDYYLENTLYSMFKGEDYDYDTIEKGEIFLSFPKKFNDPFDCAILIDKLSFERAFIKRELGEDFVNNSPFEDVFRAISFYNNCNAFVPKKVLERDFSSFEGVQTDGLKEKCDNLYNEYSKALDDIKNEYGVACFTTNLPQKNMVMWAHYANNYKGFCCQFELDFYDIDTNRDKKGTYRFAQHFRAVEYADSFVSNFVDVDQLLECNPEELKNNPYIRNFIEESFYKKYTQWSYENEHRLVINKNDTAFEKTMMTDAGFRIKFPYLFKLFINPERTRDTEKIKSICIKRNILSVCLKPSQDGIILLEDKDSSLDINLDVRISQIQ